ncbi:MAG: endolytic transglycosylase MltG [Candidatus Colwellbacteria bacterium]
MSRNTLAIIIGFSVLISGAFITWRMIVRSTPPPTPKTTVTMPEGWRVSQINDLLKEKSVLLEEELPQALEGYLFPDTYEFFLDSSVDVVEDRFIEHLQSQLDQLGLSVDDERTKEILTVASLIQQEIQDPGEMRVASGVMWKRIDAGIPLQVDASLCYIKEQSGRECLPITGADKTIDSPYNTYLYQGLPPGPIANPGIDAIEASLNPARSPYWYYISDPDTGRTIFARTLDEHNLNVIKYLSE